MRDRADDFVESGRSWAIFSGNTCFWQVRYEDDGRTMVCYKAEYAQDPVLGTDQDRLLSTMSTTTNSKPARASSSSVSRLGSLTHVPNVGGPGRSRPAGTVTASGTRRR